MRLPRLLPFALLLTACGQTGSLVLPDQPTATPSPTPVVTTPLQVEEPVTGPRSGEDAPATAAPSNDAP